MKAVSSVRSGERFLLINEVQKIVLLSKPRIYTLIAEGRFPEQVHLSANRVAWIESEILAWLNARIQERHCNRMMARDDAALDTGAA
ncbi:helix-turn-helix transcriptional regulator [Azospirillum sp. Marseille-Q6669]